VLAAAIISAAATVGLAALAYWQIMAGKKQAAEQGEAALELARETRNAAERQWQPRVFAHAWHGEPVKGDGDNAAVGEMAVRYFLQNEGTGPAFNVEHGVEVAGKLHTWNDWQYRSMRAGEAIPPLYDVTTQPVAVTPIVVGVNAGEWHDGKGLMYWTRFENLLGERFEVRNPPDATVPAEFRRVA